MIALNRYLFSIPTLYTLGYRSASGADPEILPPPVRCDDFCHTTVSKDIVFNYLWTIDKFETVAKSFPNAKTLYSDQFAIPLKDRFTVWRLKIYPNGRTPDDVGHITLFIKDSGHPEPARVNAVAEFGIIDRLGIRCNMKKIDKEYNVRNHSFGFNKYVKHADLFDDDNGLLSEGKLTLSCRMTIKAGV